MLYYISQISLVLTLLCGMFKYKSLPAAYKWFAIYLAFAFFYELAIHNWWLLWRHTDAWCNNLEGILELVLYTYFMACIDEMKPYKKSIYVAGFFVIALTIVDIAFLQGFFKLATIATVVQGVFVLLLVFMYYYILFSDYKEELKILGNPDFLVATGLLFYFLGNTFFYACFSYLAYKNNHTFLVLDRIIPSLSNTLLNVLLFFAFLRFFKKEVEQTN